MPTVSASSTAVDVFASVATETAPSPPKPDTVIAYSKATPATKCTKAYQGLGDFSSISFMAGERDQAYLPACLAYGGKALSIVVVLQKSTSFPLIVIKKTVLEWPGGNLAKL